MKLLPQVKAVAHALSAAQVAFGHGTSQAFDEAAWLVLWSLGLPLDTPLDPDAPSSKQAISPVQQAKIATLLEARISSRKPLAYLTHEAWLQGVSFYVDERVIVPRSLIAEVLVDGTLDYWLDESATRALDLCTGGGSLAVLTALTYPHLRVVASDLSADALDVARINIERHGLQERITLIESDGLSAPALQHRAPFHLIVCNPPYVNAASMAALPSEYRAEPALALDGNRAGGQDGLDFIRPLIAQAARWLKPDGVLLLEVGHERAAFEASFPALEAIWLDTSAGDDQVLLLTRQALLAQAPET